ncbi:MAG: DUF2703 domain-containing protein [Patescibacteria group bacterium]|jgi:hypothetical protein
MSNKNQCDCQSDCEPKNENKKILTIDWQRLVSDGSTCPRCGSTESELDKAANQLEKALSPLGIKVELRKIELTLEEFKKDPVKSNTILFNGVALEDLIEAKTGHSQCCDVCGDEECRTVEVNGESHETIPADIIVKAGLIAGSRIIK